MTDLYVSFNGGVVVGHYDGKGQYVGADTFERGNALVSVSRLGTVTMPLCLFNKQGNVYFVTALARKLEADLRTFADNCATAARLYAAAKKCLCHPSVAADYFRDIGEENLADKYATC